MCARKDVSYHNNFGNPFGVANPQYSFGAHMNNQLDDPSSGGPFPHLTQTPSFEDHDDNLAKCHNEGQNTDSMETQIKHEKKDEDSDLYIEEDAEDCFPTLGRGDRRVYSNQSDESEVDGPTKKRKLNKDGRERKLRKPRGHLRRWDETDLARALIGIVWACGENGINIPFAQAANLVDDRCTASALQQAILKMCVKLNKEGAQLPKIKMNWPKKGEAASEGKTTTRDNGKLPRKKPTLTQGTQCHITTLTTLRGSKGQQTLMTAGLEDHYGSQKAANVQVQSAEGSLVATQTDNSTSVAEPQESVVKAYESPNEHLSSELIDADSTFEPNLSFDSTTGRRRKAAEKGSTANVTPPMQIDSSPVCPSAPTRSRDHGEDVFAPFANNIASCSIGFAQQYPSISVPHGQSSRFAYPCLPPAGTPTTPFIQHLSMAGFGPQSNVMSRGFNNTTGLSSFNSSGSSNNSSYGAGSQDGQTLSGSEFDFSKPSLSSDRRDSFFASGASSQANQGTHMPGANIRSDVDREIRNANDRFMAAMSACVPKNKQTAMPAEKASRSDSRINPRRIKSRSQQDGHHPREVPMLGLDTIDNPFGGSFGDIANDSFEGEADVSPDNGDDVSPGNDDGAFGKASSDFANSYTMD